MSDERQEKPYPVKQSATFAGSTLVTMGLIDLLAHLGPTGLLVSGIASYVAWRHGPELYEHLRGVVSAEAAPTEQVPVASLTPSRPPQNWTVADRLLGRHLQREMRQPNDDGTQEGTSQRTRDAHDIDLAPGVQIALGDIVGKAIFVCGIRRHGKTTVGARLAEELGKHYIPLFLPCLEGDYLSLADVLPRALLAGHSSVDRQYHDYDFVALDTGKAAYQLGYDILEQGYQVILDMTSYAVLDAAVAIQIAIIRGMFQWANTHPDDRVPAHVYLDEAQRYLPQSLSDSVIQDKGVLAELLKAYMDIIAIGGKRGIAPVILTQRFAQVNKKIMAQSEVFFLLRQTNDGDLDRCMDYVHPAVASREHISTFRPGQGVYIASDGTQLVTQFHDRTSSSKRSATPQAEAARRYADIPMRRPNVETASPVLPPPTTSSYTRLREEPSEQVSPRVSEMTVEELLAMFQQRPDIDPTDARYRAQAQPEDAMSREEEPPKNVTPLLPEKGPRAEDIDIAAAVAVWNSGFTSERKLMKAFHMTQHQAGKLIERIKAQAGQEGAVNE